MNRGPTLSLPETHPPGSIEHGALPGRESTAACSTSSVACSGRSVPPCERIGASPWRTSRCGISSQSPGAGLREGPADTRRPAPVGLAHALMAGVAAGGGRRAAGNGHPVVPAVLPHVLGTEESPGRGPARDCPGTPRPHPGDQPRQSPLGRPAHPQRAPHARHHGLADHRREVPGPAAPAALTHLAYVPADPRTRPRSGRLLHCPDATFLGALRVRGPGPSPAAHRPPERHGEPHRRVDRAANRRRLPRGDRSALSAPRSRRRLRLSVPPADRRPGDPRGAHGGPLPVAESLCRTSHRLDPARVLGPRHRTQRAAVGPQNVRRRVCRSDDGGHRPSATRAPGRDRAAARAASPASPCRARRACGRRCSRRRTREALGAGGPHL